MKSTAVVTYSQRFVFYALPLLVATE